jgi:hypothetical protein
VRKGMRGSRVHALTCGFVIDAGRWNGTTFLDAEEVRGSNPLAATTKVARQRPVRPLRPLVRSRSAAVSQY